MAEALPSTASMLEHALGYLARGWSIFPVCTPVPGTPRCRQHGQCDNPGKTPLIQWGEFQKQLPTEQQVRAWWGRSADVNIGLATGALSGVVVVDLDGDLATREALSREVDVGPWAYTGRVGGRHLYFAYREDAPTIYAKPKTVGIDFRGQGGYVLLPPSLHQSGNRYRWAEPPDTALPALPRWVDELGRQSDGAGSANGTAVSGEHVDVQRLIEHGVPEGQRDQELFRLASKLRGADIPYDLAIDIVEQAAERCSPPFPLDQARAKVSSAYKRYQPNVEAPRVRLNGTTAPVDIPATWARPISSILEQAETEVDWLVKDLFSVGSSGFIAAEPKVGKSWIALDLAYCLVMGCPFLGRFEISRPRRVLFIEEEDPERRIVRRLKQLYRGSPDRGKPSDAMWRIVVRSGFRLDAPEWIDKLKAELDDFPAEVVFFDVFNKLHIKDENSQSEMSALLHELAALTRQYGCAFIIVHHYRKSGIGQSQRGNQMLRGTSALAGYAECSLYLKKGQGHKIVCDPESKDAPELEQFEIQIKEAESGVRLVSTETPTRMRESEEEQRGLDAVDALGNDGRDIEASAVAEICEWDRTKAARTLNRLVSAGKLDVETVKRGRTKFRFYSRVREGLG